MIKQHERNEHKVHMWESREQQKFLRSWARIRGGKGKPEQKMSRCALGGWGGKDTAGWDGRAHRDGRRQDSDAQLKTEEAESKGHMDTRLHLS